MSSGPSPLRLPAGLLLAGLHCLPLACAPQVQPQTKESTAALAPIRTERPDRLVDVDPSALYTEDQLAPLLVFSEGALPHRIVPLTGEALARIMPPASARIARIDLRWVQDPALWPAGAPPPGPTGIVRLVERRPPGQPPATRVQLIQPGTTLEYDDTEHSGLGIQPVLEYLAAAPRPLSWTREAQPQQSAGAAAEQPWLEIKVLVREQPQVALVPRRELIAPRDSEAAAALASGAQGGTPPPVEWTAPADPETAPQWADEDPAGVLFQQAVDPGAVLYTATWSPPGEREQRAQALREFAEWLAGWWERQSTGQE